MILTLRVSNTVGMTMLRLPPYSKGTDAFGITLGTVHWGPPIIQYSQSPLTATFWVYQHSGVRTSVFLKAVVCHSSGCNCYSWNNDLGVPVLWVPLVTQ